MTGPGDHIAYITCNRKGLGAKATFSHDIICTNIVPRLAVNDYNSAPYYGNPHVNPISLLAISFHIQHLELANFEFSNQIAEHSDTIYSPGPFDPWASS